MANPSISNVDLGGVLLVGETFQDDVVTDASGTVPAGTIMARDTSTLKLIPFVKGGSTNGNGIPRTVLLNDVEANGADAQLPMSCLVKGEVRFDKLIIAADGDNSNVDANVIDDLNEIGIIVRQVDQLNIQDNQ